VECADPDAIGRTDGSNEVGWRSRPVARDAKRQFVLNYRNAWQSLACSPPGIAESPVAGEQ